MSDPNAMSNLLSSADILTRGLSLPPLDTAPLPVPDGTRCAMTGQPLTEGYRVMDITTDATNEFLDTFRGQPTGWVSETVGRTFRQDHNLGARLIFGDGTPYRPLISAESAAKPENAGRPSWSRLVRDVWPSRAGQPVLCLLTTDTKKRLWPHSRVGPLGEATPVYLHDSGHCISASVTLSWPKMLGMLDLLETIYAVGFGKSALAESLWRDLKRAQEAGYAQTTAWEHEIAPWRGCPEFTFALLIAQKPIAEKPTAEEPNEPLGETPCQLSLSM